MARSPKPASEKEERDERLAAALRENLKRRKAQIRSQARQHQDKSTSSTEDKTGG